MKAKDTVVDIAEDKYDGLGADTLVEIQAEISFKAGIKEVVEFEQLYPYETHRSPTGLLCRVIRIPLAEWQAKLKEWEIEGGK